MPLQRSHRGSYAPHNPVWIREAVPADLTAAGYVPAGGGIFRGLNASVAGLVKILGLNDEVVVEYLNTGWNPSGGKAIIKDAGNTATVKCAALET